MICIEGTGAVSHVSVRNHPDIFNEPLIFAGLCVKGGNGGENIARVIEGPIPGWKYFGKTNTGNGAPGTSYGLPRFSECSFDARFPYGTVTLNDEDIPLEVSITAWSPFIPGDADNSSLPAGALEYHFKNLTKSAREAVFSFNTKNFMEIGRNKGKVLPIENGYVLWQEGSEEKPWDEGALKEHVWKKLAHHRLDISHP